MSRSSAPFLALVAFAAALGCGRSDKVRADSIEAVLQAQKALDSTRADSLQAVVQAQQSAEAKRLTDSAASAKHVADSVATDLARPRELELFDASPIRVQNTGFVVRRFELPSAGKCRISGRIEVTAGGSKDLAVYVMTPDQFTNWSNNPRSQPLGSFVGQRQTITSLNTPLASPGRYVLVLSNTFSALTPKSATATVTVRCVGGPQPRTMQ